jgi:hypothetical protein
VLTPENDELKADLRGDLAGILTVANNTKRPVPSGNGLSNTVGKTQVKLVAGACNHRQHTVCVEV